MKCPCCPNRLKVFAGNIVECVRGHKFQVQLNGSGVVLVMAADPIDKCGCKRDDVFPVPEGTDFEAARK